MGKKLYESVSEYPRKVYLFHCPGCGFAHSYCTARPPGEAGPVWTFNGNLESPTFTPSLLYNVNRSNPTEHLCHTYVTDGKIQFLSDCTHHLAGQTVAMEDIE